MIKVLIVDDEASKIRGIRKVLASIAEVTNIEIASDIISAKKLLSQEYFDLLILDLNLPMRIGDDASPNTGIIFLEEINRSHRLNKPFHIIGLTAYEEFKTEFKEKFEDDLWALISYDISSNKWEKQIENKIQYLVYSKRVLQNPQNIPYQYDLGIITALHTPELDAIFNLCDNWDPITIPNDPTKYYKGKLSNGENSITVVAASAPQMGMVAATTLTLKMISNFRPKYIAMTGIAGGVEGKGNLGDIIAAEIVFDYGSGKSTISKDGNDLFEPDYKSINLISDIKEPLLNCRSNRQLLDKIKYGWKADRPSTELNLVVGPFASGASVVENENIIKGIKEHSRKLVGVDMETYGVFYAVANCSNPKPKGVLSLKSISDFANPDKNDNFQKYASYTSACFLKEFLFLNVNLFD